MAKVNMEIYLSEKLPLVYSNPSLETKEKPVKDVEELCQLYKNKYDTFGHIESYIYTKEKELLFREALNGLFKKQEMDIIVDKELLSAMVDTLTPIIVVDNEIISKGIYPDLTSLRGGSNSISRGGTGEHTH